MAGAEWTHPLGNKIRVRIDREYASLRTYRGRSRSSVVEGCKLPPLKDLSAGTGSRRTFSVDFDYISLERAPVSISTTTTSRKESFQGTVQWNEKIYM